MTLTAEMKKGNRRLNIIFCAVLLVQVFVLAHFGRIKQEYHIDEIYSYILSNSYEADRIANEPSVWNNWVSGQDFDKFVTVNRGQEFAYKEVYYNNTLDAHPPLYYFCLHTVCSFFPERFSKWFGIGLNMVIFVFSQLLLYRLSRRIFGNTAWALLPVMIYGGTNVAFNTALYIRMYMLLTMFTLLLANVHYEMLKSSFSLNWGITCFLVTFLGIFTHYFFALFAFFTAVFTCCYYLLHKQWKEFIQYGLCMLGAVGAVFYAYPAAVKQITGSATNDIGNKVKNSLFDFSAWGKSFMTIGYYDLKKGLTGGLVRMKPALAVTAAGTIAAAVWKRRKAEKPVSEPDVPMLVSLFLILFLCTAAIAKISGQYAYFRYLYYLMPLLALVIAWLLYVIVRFLPLNGEIIAAGASVFWLCGTAGIFTGNVNAFLYNERYQNNQRIADLCKDRPLVVINNGKTYHPTANFTILEQCDEVYMTTPDNMGDIDSVLNQVDTGNGAVFMVLTDQDWSGGFDGDEVMTKVISESDILNSYTDEGSCVFSEVYLAVE